VGQSAEYHSVYVKKLAPLGRVSEQVTLVDLTPDGSGFCALVHPSGSDETCGHDAWFWHVLSPRHSWVIK
jgi:hypothetical protein